MSAEKWLKTVIGNTAPTAAARRAGVQPSTVTRQLEAGQISPEVAVKIARAFDAPVLDALVSVGLITDTEADLKDRMVTETALETATDEALLRELLRRVEAGGRLAHPELTEPLDDEHVTRLVTPTPPANESEPGGNVVRVPGWGADVDVTSEPGHRYAAHDTGTDPATEAEALEEYP